MSSEKNKEVLRNARHPHLFKSPVFAKCYEFIYKVECVVIYLREYAPDRVKPTFVENIREVFSILGADSEESAKIVFLIKTFRNSLVHELHPALSLPLDSRYLNVMLEIVGDLLELCADAFAVRAKQLNTVSIFS